MLFDMRALNGADTYKLLAATIVPRPIAWVTTIDGTGQVNAAPYSFFNAMSGSPPVICFGIGGRGAGDVKDTGNNIRETGEFVVNLVAQANATAMNVTAIEFPPDVNELAEAGLTSVPGSVVKPPRISESPVSLECERMVMVDVGNSRTIVIGRVLAMHVRDDCVLDQQKCHIDTPKLELIGRMHGRGWYATTRDRFDLPRLDVATWEAGRPVGR